MSSHWSEAAWILIALAVISFIVHLFRGPIGDGVMERKFGQRRRLPFAYYFGVFAIIRKVLHLESCCRIFLNRMQQDEHNADDVAASERARQREKRGQKTHAKKSKD